MNEQKLNSQFWKEFYGMLQRTKTLEEKVSKLWEKWDWGQKMVVGILVAMLLNLMGVIWLITNGVK